MPSVQQLLVAVLAATTSVNGSPLQLAGPNTTPTHRNELVKARADKPWYIPEMPEKCLSVDFYNRENQKKAWEESKAGFLADAFIRNNDMKLENWVQNLFKLIFPGKNAETYSCTEATTACGPVPDCIEFENAGYVGGYYLFKSISASHAFFREFKDQVFSIAIRNSLDIHRVIADFHYKAPQEEEVNGFAIMSGAFGAMSGLAFASGPVAGALGAVSAISGIIGSTQSKQKSTIDPADVEGSLASIVKDAFEAGNQGIDKIIKAMYSGGDQKNIPASMQKELWGSEALRALGEGQWLSDNPTSGLQDLGNHMAHQMEQALAWQMLRLGREAFVLMNDAWDEEKCASGADSVWSPKRKACFELLHMIPEPRKGLGPGIDYFKAEETGKLWGEYGMDKLATYENTAECWESHGGNMGDAGSLNDITNLGLTSCTFGMVVRKGWMEFMMPSIGLTIVPLDMGWAGQDKTKMACSFPCLDHCNPGDGCE